MNPLAGILLVILWFYTTNAQTGVIHSTSVIKRDVAYEIGFDITVNADFPFVYSRLMDHDRFHELSDIIIESQKLTDSQHSELRRLRVHTCVLFYCKDFIFLESLEVVKGVILGRVVPGGGDFYSGQSRWQVMAELPDQTRVRFHSTIIPMFWIPPLIGPWLLEKRLARELVVMIERLEANAS